MIARALPRLVTLGAPLVGALAISCGEPVVSQPAYETPLMTVQGLIVPYPITDFVSPRVGVVWVDPLGIEPDVPAVGPQVLASSDSPNFTSSPSFHLRFFAPPPAPMIRTLVDPNSKRAVASFALGELVLYDDRDGDGRFVIDASDAIVGPDQYLGAGQEDVVFYVSQSLGGNDGPTALKAVLAGQSGYQLAWADCSAPAGPSFDPLNDPNPIEVVVAQVAAATSQLPFMRNCLRSHVDPPLMGTGP
jgi:hypothetical protein